jgi:poly(hydroxyalkanoate) granule-associated protein
MLPRNLNLAVPRQEQAKKETIMTRKSPAKRTTARKTVKPVRKAHKAAMAGNRVEKALLAGIHAASNAREATNEAVGKVLRKASSLVRQGQALQVQGARAAMHRAEEARTAAMATANEARTRATAAVSHIEKAFEQRVSRALEKVGVPTSQSVRNLTRRVAELQANVDKLRRSRARA